MISFAVLFGLMWVLAVCPLTGRRLAGAGMTYPTYVVIGAWVHSAIATALGVAVAIVAAVLFLML